MIETLEYRKLLSATLADPAALSASSHVGAAPVDMSMNHASHRAKAVITTTPSLVHNYSGKLKTRAVIFGLGSRKLDFTLDITGQTSDSLTGHFAVGNNASGDATLHGFEKTNGRFSYSTDANGFTFKISGKVGNNGLRLGGNASINVSSVSVFKTSGGFVVNATS
jgi:hypothetical protein